MNIQHLAYLGTHLCVGNSKYRFTFLFGRCVDQYCSVVLYCFHFVVRNRATCMQSLSEKLFVFYQWPLNYVRDFQSYLPLICTCAPIKIAFLYDILVEVKGHNFTDLGIRKHS